MAEFLIALAVGVGLNLATAAIDRIKQNDAATIQATVNQIINKASSKGQRVYDDVINQINDSKYSQAFGSFINTKLLDEAEKMKNTAKDLRNDLDNLNSKVMAAQDATARAYSYDQVLQGDIRKDIKDYAVKKGQEALDIANKMEERLK